MVRYHGTGTLYCNSSRWNCQKELLARPGDTDLPSRYKSCIPPCLFSYSQARQDAGGGQHSKQSASFPVSDVSAYAGATTTFKNRRRRSKFCRLFILLNQIDIVRHYCTVSELGTYADSTLVLPICIQFTDGLLYNLTEKVYVVINTLLDLWQNCENTSCRNLQVCGLIMKIYGFVSCRLAHQICKFAKAE